MTLEDLVAEISAAGLLLNNLFQLNSGLWRASLRNKASINFHFYDGRSPTEAVRGAIRASTPGSGMPARKNEARVLREKTVVAAKSGQDLLNILGL